MGWLLGVYIAASVFGAGVTLIDLLGFIGHGADHGGGHTAGHGGGPGGAHGADHGGSHAPAQVSGHDTHGEHVPTHDAVPTPAHDGLPHQPAPGSLVAQDPQPRGGELGLRALSAARTLVYFCFGFGPLGWIATAFGVAGARSLLWSIPTGVLFAATGLGIRSIQRSVLDSQVREEELLLEKAEVTVPIEPGSLGKVRALVGGRYVERFARARDPSAAMATGTRVKVVEVSDEGVIVEQA